VAVLLGVGVGVVAVLLGVGVGVVVVPGDTHGDGVVVAVLRALGVMTVEDEGSGALGLVVLRDLRPSVWNCWLPRGVVGEQADVWVDSLEEHDGLVRDGLPVVAREMSAKPIKITPTAIRARPYVHTAWRRVDLTARIAHPTVAVRTGCHGIARTERLTDSLRRSGSVPGCSWTRHLAEVRWLTACSELLQSAGDLAIVTRQYAFEEMIADETPGGIQHVAKLTWQATNSRLQ
jgi:hypothetical protein